MSHFSSHRNICEQKKARSKPGLFRYQTTYRIPARMERGTVESTLTPTLLLAVLVSVPGRLRNINSAFTAVVLHQPIDHLGFGLGGVESVQTEGLARAVDDKTVFGKAAFGF